MGKRVALYLRASSTDPSARQQRRDLRKAAKDHRWEIVAEFCDQPVDPKKDRPPALLRLLEATKRKEFGLVAVWGVERLGLSLQEVNRIIGELRSMRVEVYLHQPGLDTSTRSGKALFQMMGIFAEFERTMILERASFDMLSPG